MGCAFTIPFLLAPIIKSAAGVGKPFSPGEMN
jgi:hypothetical protein